MRIFRAKTPRRKVSLMCRPQFVEGQEPHVIFKKTKKTFSKL